MEWIQAAKAKANVQRAELNAKSLRLKGVAGRFSGYRWHDPVGTAAATCKSQLQVHMVCTSPVGAYMRLRCLQTLCTCIRSHMAPVWKLRHHL